MIFEVLVLNRRHSVIQNFRALLVSHQNAPLQRKAGNHLPVIGVDFRDYVRTVSFQRANLRQVAGIDEQQTASSAKRNRAEQQERDSDTVDKFPTAQAKCDRRQT